MLEAVMETLKKIVCAQVGHISDLSGADYVLLQYAKGARKNAQAPYSNYCVGVAVRADNGRIFMGCNVERASWTQTTHAEQNAIDSMVAQLGPTKIAALALVAAPEGKEANLCADERPFDKVGAFEGVPVPCGHCLQIIWENCFNDPNVKLISARDGHVFLTTIGDALPMRFGPRELGVDYAKNKTRGRCTGVIETASKIVNSWSKSKRAAFEQRTGLKLFPKKITAKECHN